MDPGLGRPHPHKPRLRPCGPSVVAEEQWIAANARLIEEMGAPTYLMTLLSVLRENNRSVHSPAAV
jgi:hypothetical protein